MFKTLIGRIVGYQAEIESLRQQVAELSWDEPFGMWTRAAFLRQCRLAPTHPAPLAFLDLNDIGLLNLEYGYVEVDRRIHALFDRLRQAFPGLVIARWYSGDEIVILFPTGSDPHPALAFLSGISMPECGLSFVYALGCWEAGDSSIQAAIERLSAQTCTQKLQSSFPSTGEVAYESRGSTHGCTDWISAPQEYFRNAPAGAGSIKRP